MKHTEKWFLNRIGKRVFRNEVDCQCEVCKRNGREGLIIGDGQHATYLYDCQGEMEIEYRDKK